MKYLAMIIAVMVTLMGVVSCDDDDVNPDSLAASAAGTYMGTFCVWMPGVDSNEDVSIKIKAIDENTVSLTTTAVGEGSMALPAFTVKDLTVTKSQTSWGEEYTFADHGEFTGSIGEKSYVISDLVMSISLSSMKVGLHYKLKYDNMPAAVAVDFSGERQ